MTSIVSVNTLAAAVIAVGALSGCANQTPGERNQAIGGVLGAAAGAAVGSRFGSGLGRTAATLGGALLGGLAGSVIAQRMTPQDRNYHQQTTYQALENAPPNQPVQWQNPQTRVQGVVTPTSDYYAYNPNEPQQQCRDFRQEISIPGEYDPQYETGTACRNPDGTWTRVNS